VPNVPQSHIYDGLRRYGKLN